MELTIRLKNARVQARDLAVKGTYTLSELPRLANLAFGAAAHALTNGGKVDADAIESLTVRKVLGRQITESDRIYLREVIQSRALSEWALPFSFFRLPNGVEKRLLGTLAIERHHAARKLVVRDHLPAASRVLDLGGATEEHAEGALLGMGYRHRPVEVHVVDLPRDERYHSQTGPDPRDMQTNDGATVKYSYSTMSDLQRFSSNTFDLVWSGQSIEHIHEAEAEITLREVFRILKPGGSFCLDTPNRRITRLISRHFLHHDHKIEYVPSTLAEKLSAAGFDIVAKKAVTPLPVSARLQRLSKLEILNEARVGDHADDGLSFFIHSRKP